MNNYNLITQSFTVYTKINIFTKAYSIKFPIERKLAIHIIQVSVVCVCVCVSVRLYNVHTFGKLYDTHYVAEVVKLRETIREMI